MKIQGFYLKNPTQVLTKLVKELFSLFRIEIDEGSEASRLLIAYEVQPPKVTVRLTVSEEKELTWAGEIRSAESLKGGVHRLVKLGLYELLRRRYGFPAAPWGVLHGVRPAKIVHRWLKEGLLPAEVVPRLQADYACSCEKARLLKDLAERQCPLLAANDDKTVGVYVGIPFCLSRCLYCSFPSYVLPGEKQLKAFMEVFYRDLRAVEEAVRRYGFKTQSIYIGGGTPTSLPENFFAEMLAAVRSAFAGPNLVEFTLEAGRPDSISKEKIFALQRAGVSRVSVNPQSMRDVTLQRIGRGHSAKDIDRMYKTLRAAGNFHINMDVILGLPGETVADAVYTLERVTALRPDDITLHALALKKGSPLKLKLDEQEQVSLPSDEVVREMYAVATDLIEKAGYRPYYLYRQGYMAGDLENIGYARPGAESVYNIQVISEEQTILGVGGGASTKIIDRKNKRILSAFNPKDLFTYMKDIDIYIAKRNQLLAEVYT